MLNTIFMVIPLLLSKQYCLLRVLKHVLDLLKYVLIMHEKHGLNIGSTLSC